MDIQELGLPSRIEKLLIDTHRFRTVEEIASLNAREILALPKIGELTLRQIADAVIAKGLELAADPWAPYECARHGEPAWDANLSNFFLCEECASAWQSEPFAGTAPLYAGEVTKSYCLNCNQNVDVRLVQWTLCGTCERVARSIGRSVVAGQFVMDSWKEQVNSVLPTLELQDVDPPRLLRRTKDVIKDKVASVDFKAIDTATGEALLGIELKTGKGYIDGPKVGSKISEFQLDNSDCDDILTVVKQDELPVYLVHAQVIDRIEPPTVRYVALGLWWADLFSMETHFKSSRQRPRENRIAAYYDTAMFQPFDEFAEHIRAKEPDEIRTRLAKRGWAVKLY